MIIAIDFDGTIVFDKYPGIGSLIPDAKRVITQLHNDGHKIIINTCREGKYERNCVNFLHDSNIPFDRINDNLSDNIARYGVNCRKISADIYIDDKQIGGLLPWKTIYEIIKLRDNEV